MVRVISLSLALISSVSPIQDQEKSVFRQLFPQPTGINGYEEYVMAGELLRSPERKRFNEWLLYFNNVQGSNKYVDEDTGQPMPIPEAPPGLTMKSTQLDIRQYQVRISPKVTELVVRGNRKDVSMPQKDLNIGTAFPELSHFKEISKHMVVEAYVQASSGHPHEASERLREAMRFAHNISSGTLIHLLVGYACTGILLAGYEQHLSQLGLSDLEQTEKLARALLADESPLRTAIKTERLGALRCVEDMLFPRDKTSADDMGEYLGKEVTTAILNLPESIRREAMKALTAKLDIQFTELLAQLEAQEAKRHTYTDPDMNSVDEDRDWDTKPPKTVNDLVELAESSLLPGYSAVFSTTARRRTQLRVLVLHCQVLSYKWRHLKLPDKLEQCADKSDIHDPVSGKDFQYVRLGPTSFQLHSVGFGDTGQIGLVYRRPPSDFSDTGTEPPPRLVRRR